MHTGLRVAGAAKTFFSKNVTLFKKIKHIKYVSVDDIRFWFLNAGENFGFYTGLRWFLQILLDTFLYINLPPRLLEILKKIVKNVTLFVFLSILYA